MSPDSHSWGKAIVLECPFDFAKVGAFIIGEDEVYLEEIIILLNIVRIE